MNTPSRAPKRAFQRWTDRLATGVITIAGIAVIAAMLAMVVLIVREAAPLFMPATQKEVGRIALPEDVPVRDVMAIGVDADLRDRVRVAGIILRDGRCGFVFLNADGTKELSLSRLPGAPEEVNVHFVECYGNSLYTVLWENGDVALYSFSVEFSVRDEKVVSAPRFSLIFGSTFDVAAGMPLYAMLRGEEPDHRAVAVFEDGRVVEKQVRRGKGLLARGKSVATTRTIRLQHGGRITAAVLNENGMLYAGTDQGTVVSADLSVGGEGVSVDTTLVLRDRRSVTALTFLNGGYAVAVGDAAGGVSVWFPRRENGVFRFRRSAQWDAGKGAITGFAVSGRDRGCMTRDAAGTMRWLYSTTGKELFNLPPAASPVVGHALNARADHMATLQADGLLRMHRLDSSYPEAGWTGFFRRLLYEGYEKAAFVWQSTGSDASEPKLSLVPLIWGSVKAAIYAMAFATPIALAAAMYLSQFAAPVWRARLKPAVEMLAAVPSVVTGFLAALWLAPLLERYLQFFVKQYPYDQRNSLVIAIAMGFAVIPTIFSLAEDAISAVPSSLSAASLALGASKWQTVCRVVLPTASPGIFTAVMLGFGRAVGETMIVLMAAGNTPILSLSPFNGMRTLSANIAVEMPEAPVGGTLYRTLFLCALILFFLTLIINTAAEVFRHRLRRRYGRL